MKVQVVLAFCATLLIQNIHGKSIQHNTKADVENLKKALDASPVDGTAIMKIITDKTSAQRLNIVDKYKDIYKKDLRNEFKEKLSAEFGNLIIALITPSPEYYAKELHNAMEGVGTDDNCLIEILSTLSNQELKKVCKAYQEIYGVTLQSAISDDTSSYFQELLIALSNGVRNESNVVNPSEAVADAVKLYQAGEMKWGTDESMFISILTQRSPKQLKQIGTEYKRLTGHELGYIIQCEFSGLLKEGLLTLANVAVSSVFDYFAGRINESIGTNHNVLTRIMAMRGETDMVPIQSSYVKKYGMSLKDAISDQTSGDYKTGLLALLGEK